MFTGNPGHLRTFSYLGLYRYSLTWCTDHRRHLFVSAETVDVVRSQISRAAAAEEFAIIAYCFMPDHLHLLVEARNEVSDCRRFIRRAKQLSGFAYSRGFGAGLWQRYGYEHVLRSNEDTLRVARYILENPVRAKLVTRVQEYPFAGSEMHSIADILEATGSG